MRWVLFCLVVAGCGRIDFDVVTDRCALHAFVDEPYANSFEGADGVTTPFLICSDSQLARISQRPEDWDKAFELGADIDLLGVTVTPIGTFPQPFTGTFDGAGHTISNLHLDLAQDDVGLFGEIGDRAHLTNVSLTGADVRGVRQVGALVGFAAQNVLLDHIHVDGLIRGTREVGGVVGYADCEPPGCDKIVLHDVGADVDVEGMGNDVGGIIGGLYNDTNAADLRDLRVSGRVKGDRGVGGIVGDMEPAVVDGASSSATVECNIDCGGAVGSTVFAVRSLIRNSVATGDIFCNSQCGGLAGEVEGSIERSYATGNVTCTGSTCGGLAGLVLRHVWESYATGDVSGPGPYMAGLVADMEGDDLRDSYATGTVASTGDRVGGLVGIGINVVVTRSYSTSNVSGADRVAALVAEIDSGSTQTSELTDCFATGSVSGASGTNNVSTVLAYQSGPLVVTGNAYASTATCTNTTGTCTTVGTAVANESAFYSAATPPLTTWDFTTVWQENPGALPTLRNTPP